MWLRFSEKVADGSERKFAVTESKILPRCQNSLAAHFCPYGNLVGECLPQTLLCGLRRKNISVRQTGTAPEIPNRPAYFL